MSDDIRINEALEKIRITEAGFDIRDLTGYSVGSLRRAAWKHKGESYEDAFAAMMEERGTGRDAYVAVRDEIRAGLRIMGGLQRDRRKAEILLRDSGIRDKRKRTYSDRMLDRREISLLIDVRRAGKKWSRDAREKAAAAAE